MLTSAVLGLVLLKLAHAAPAPLTPYVDTAYPYTGPKVPVGDWVNQAIDNHGSGGYARITEPPAVLPSYPNPTNNINVISLAFTPGGMHVHFQTPFGIDGEPCVIWGTEIGNLNQTTKGWTRT